MKPDYKELSARLEIICEQAFKSNFAEDMQDLSSSHGDSEQSISALAAKLDHITTMFLEKYHLTNDPVAKKTFNAVAMIYKKKCLDDYGKV